MTDPSIEITDKILVVLLDEEAPEKTTSEIRQICEAHGAPTGRWNISNILSVARGQGKVKSLDGRWSLRSTGRDHLSAEGLVPQRETVISKQRNDLRGHLDQIGNTQIRDFVAEAVGCLEANLLRSAVVMSWIGAVAVLYEYVIANHLPTFNAESTRRDSKWKAAANTDDLARMKESDFLNILEAIHILGHSVKIGLQECLNRRNACGHPNSYRIGEQAVAAHIEYLILHVYSMFA